MTVNKSDFQMEEIPDECPDTSYLDQEDWEDRRKEYERGDFYFVGVRAVVELHIPSKQGGHLNTQQITSPGLWGIESDSRKDYFQEVFQEESNTLAEMLETMGIQVIDDTNA